MRNYNFFCFCDQIKTGDTDISMSMCLPPSSLKAEPRKSKEQMKKQRLVNIRIILVKAHVPRSAFPLVSKSAVKKQSNNVTKKQQYNCLTCVILCIQFENCLSYLLFSPKFPGDVQSGLFQISQPYLSKESQCL